MTKSKYRPKENKSDKGKKKRKQQKLHLVFDPSARQEYLTGFHKRKLEKKTHYVKKMEKKVAEERKRIRAEAKKSMKNVSASHSVVPEVKALLENAEPLEFSTADSYEVGSKTVTITTLDKIHPVIPDIKEESSGDEDGEASDGEPKQSASKMKAVFNKSTNRLLQNSIVYKKAQRLKQKKNKPKPNKLFQKDAKNKKGKGEAGKGDSMKNLTKGKRRRLGASGARK